jgi:Ca-activated chloride channel family protein
MDMVPRVVYMSADDSNSMASPGHVREIINDGFEPNPYNIRTYEFLNYYRIAYDAAAPGALSIFPEMEKTADAAIADFQIGVRSFDAPAFRRPMNFTFLVDTSGSMKGPGIERAKAAVEAIASQFVAGDIVSFITTDPASAKLDGHTVNAPNDPDLLSLVNGLTTGGKTDLLTAITEAYTLAGSHQDDNRMNRIIFISDGGVNVGVTDIPLIAEKSADADKEGIYLVGIGTGPALSYNDYVMNTITDAGRGAYVYLDSKEEAKSILADRFDEVMDIAARAVQVELTLPWYLKVEGISTELPLSTMKVQPQHLAPNDAMVFFLKTTACDPSLYNTSDQVGIRVFWKTRQKYESQLTEVHVPLKTLIGEKSPRMAKGRAIVAYAEALKACGFDKNGVTLCKDDTERKKVTKEKLLAARDLAILAKAGLPDAELDEIVNIIDIHPLMQ